jgi:phosphatidate cytidylyltransferase
VTLILQTKRSEKTVIKLEHVRDRVHSWYVILFLIVFAYYFNKAGICVLFFFVSFFGLREFITLAPTRPGDHRSLFWMFFLILPLQYLSVYNNWNTIFVYLIPAFSLIFLPFRSSISGDTSKFLERTSSMQWGLIISVYCISHLPALLYIQIPNYSRNAELLLFFVFTTQINEVIQHEVGLWFGKFKIAPDVSRLRTWEGWFLGTLITTGIGGIFYFLTPFNIKTSMLVTFICVQLSLVGGIVISAIKRSRGIQAFDELIPGHGGILDRVDSILFSGPVFFHILKSNPYNILHILN